SLQVSKRVLELHQLNKEVVFGIEAGSVNRALEIEREPLLNPVHAGALGEIEEQGHVEHDWSGQNAVATKEVDFELHGIAEPAHQVNVVPSFFIVAARRVVIDADNVTEVLVQVRVKLRLKDVVEDRLLALFLRLEGFRIVKHFPVAV